MDYVKITNEDKIKLRNKVIFYYLQNIKGAGISIWTREKICIQLKRLSQAKYLCEVQRFIRNMSEEDCPKVFWGEKMKLNDWMKKFNSELDKVLKEKVETRKGRKSKYRYEYTEIPEEFWQLICRESKVFKKIVDKKHEGPVNYPNIGGFRVKRGDKLQVHATEIDYSAQSRKN